MTYINIDECLQQIDETRIDRENGANVYLGITPKEIVLELAYSKEKKDHMVLKRTSLPADRKYHEAIWVEYLAVAMIIEHSYKVRRFVDDVRRNMKK